MRPFMLIYVAICTGLAMPSAALAQAVLPVAAAVSADAASAPSDAATVADGLAADAGAPVAVQAAPHKSVLVVVWGFRDWFQSAALKTAFTAYVLDINTPVLLFDWPGNQGQGASGYRASRQVAYQSPRESTFMRS